MMMRTSFFGKVKTMRNSRVSWIASAIVCAFTLSAFAQTEPAKPAPAKEPVKAEPAKPATTVTTTTTTTVSTTAAIGKPAPDFKLNDVNGKTHSLADYKGKVVVLEWSNFECPVCARHAKSKTAEKTLAAYKDKGVVWLNIDSNFGSETKQDGIKKFNKDNGLTAAWVLDPSGATGKAYGAKTTPHVFVIDQKGNLAYMGAIDDDNKGDKGDKAKNYVKDAIDAVLKGSTVATATTEPYGCSVKYKG